jgi:hypothetical protein
MVNPVQGLHVVVAGVVAHPSATLERSAPLAGAGPRLRRSGIGDLAFLARHCSVDPHRPAQAAQIDADRRDGPTPAASLRLADACLRLSSG